MYIRTKMRHLPRLCKQNRQADPWKKQIKVKLKMVIYIRFLSEQADAQGIQIQYWYWGPLLSQSLPMASEQTHLKQKPIKLASLAVIRLQVLAYL